MLPHRSKLVAPEHPSPRTKPPMPEDRRALRLQFDEHGKDGEHGAQQHQGEGGEADIQDPLRRQVPCVESRCSQLHQRGALLPNHPWVDAGDARGARSREQPTAARQRRVDHEREIAIRQGTGNENRIGASIVDHPGELTERAARRTSTTRLGTRLGTTLLMSFSVNVRDRSKAGVNPAMTVARRIATASADRAHNCGYSIISAATATAPMIRPWSRPRPRRPYAPVIVNASRQATANCQPPRVPGGISALNSTPSLSLRTA